MWKDIGKRNEMRNGEGIKIDKAYKRLKKTSVAAYRFPKELSAATGFDSMSLDGIACSGLGRYSVCYKVSGLQPGDLARQIRENDFSVEFSKARITDYEGYLAVYAYENNMDAAKEELESSEAVLAGIIEKNNGTAERLDFTGRMCYVHSCLAFGFAESRNTDSDYLGNLTEWPDDFAVGIQYGIDKKHPAGIFDCNGVSYRICFIRKFNRFVSGDSLLTILSSYPNISHIKTCMQPVSDYAAAVQFRETFLDADVTVQRLKRKNEKLYPVLDTTDNGKKDSRHFCLGSMMFLFRGESRESLQDEYEELENEMIDAGYRLDYYYGAMLEAIQALPAGSYPLMNPLRLLRSQNMGYLIPYHEERISDRAAVSQFMDTGTHMPEERGRFTYDALMDLIH